MTVGFFGHSEVVLTIEEHNKLKTLLINLLKNNDFITFFLGGYGSFDYTCVKILKELKNQYSNFKSIFITPYTNETYLKNRYDKKLYDDCIYPPLERTPKKFTILKRNYWIVDNCDFLIFHILYSFGGAVKIYEYAKRKNIELINISNI